jgi:hypothetical protein
MIVKRKIIIVGLVCALLFGNYAATQTLNFEKRPLERIEAGTQVIDDGAGPWNRLVLVARSSMKHGDTSAVAQNIRDSVTAFQLTLMAKIVAPHSANGPGNAFQLQSVGIGYANPIRGQLKIVDVANASKLGLELDYAAEQWLTESERQLEAVYMLAITPTVAVFDVPSIVRRNSKHQEFMVRHFLWLDATTGRITILMWLLENRERGQPLRLVEEPLRLVATPVYPDRLLHVDGREFYLGLPTRMAFAIEDLPPGKGIPWSSDLKPFANLSQFDERSLTLFASELNTTLEPFRESNTPP